MHKALHMPYWNHIQNMYSWTWTAEFRAPLIWSKNIGFLEDLKHIGKFPMKPFETKNWILSYPLKFLWNGQSYWDFGGNLARAPTSWKLSFESISLIPFLCFSCGSIKRLFLCFFCVLPLFCIYIPVRILRYFFLFLHFFSFLRFKGALNLWWWVTPITLSSFSLISFAPFSFDYTWHTLLSFILRRLWTE